MQHIANGNLLQLRQGTVQNVRKLYGLDGKGRMDEAIDLLQDWINKQPHFNKKDFSREYLEVMLIMCKGLVERAKTKLEKYCTYKTLMPKYFEVFDPYNDVHHCQDVFKVSILPKTTKDHARVIIMEHFSHPKLSSNTCMACFRRVNMIMEYMKVHDYSTGVILITDYKNINLAELLIQINVVELNQYLAIFTEAYGFRLKSYNMISNSKTISSLVAIVKKALRSKLADRIRVHNTYDTLYEVVPKEILPVEYGGDEKSTSELAAELTKEITSKGHLKHLMMMEEALTNEELRPADQLKNEYLGTPGTFRTMNVD